MSALSRILNDDPPRSVTPVKVETDTGEKGAPSSWEQNTKVWANVPPIHESSRAEPVAGPVPRKRKRAEGRSLNGANRHVRQNSTICMNVGVAYLLACSLHPPGTNVVHLQTWTSARKFGMPNLGNMFSKHMHALEKWSGGSRNRQRLVFQPLR